MGFFHHANETLVAVRIGAKSTWLNVSDITAN